MNLSPSDENGIVLTILRDTYDILVHTPKFSFDYNAKVKLQKAVFLIAKELNIPLTRSWYRRALFNKSTFLFVINYKVKKVKIF